MDRLPAPLTVTDELLTALHSEIVGLRADLAATRGQGGEPATGRTVELREPSVTPRKRTAAK